MDFDAIRVRYRDFLDWNSDNVDDRMTRIAGEYAYFQTLYIQASRKRNTLSQEKDELWQGKRKFYKHEFEETLSQADLNKFVEKDLDIIKIQSKITNHQTFMTFFEECMKNLNNMRWDIKSYIDYKKFMAGINT